MTGQRLVAGLPWLGIEASSGVGGAEPGFEATPFSRPQDEGAHSETAIAHLR